MATKITTLFVIALGFIQTTLAANGHVHVNGVELQQPTGCINVNAVQFSINQFPQVSLENGSDKVILIFDEANCHGNTKTVIPNQGYTSHMGKSFYIE